MPDPLNAVVDISHHNGNIDLQQAKGDGIIGVIHKATQGQTGLDPMYVTNRGKAQAAGLLWGAYHFATGGDGVEQAQHFLDTVGTFQNTLLVLDFEPNPSGPSMSLEDARAFVTHVNQVTGRFPGFYSGSYIKQLLGTRKDPVLAQCWLWLAQYGPTAVVPETGRHGPCGNTRTAQSAPSHMKSLASDTAIETSSTALKINCEHSG